jgi:hypothetical protein
VEKMESEEKADTSTLEKTGHLYFGPTPTGKLAKPVGFPAAWSRLSKLYGQWRERSRAGLTTRVAALFHSLIESAKLCGVEPRGYLGEAARRTIRSQGTVTLPRDFK